MRPILLALLALALGAAEQSEAAAWAAKLRDQQAAQNQTWQHRFGLPFYVDLYAMKKGMARSEAIPAAFVGPYYLVEGDTPDSQDLATKAGYTVRAASVASTTKDRPGDLPAPQIYTGKLGALPLVLLEQASSGGPPRLWAVVQLPSGRVQVWDGLWVDREGQQLEPQGFYHVAH